MQKNQLQNNHKKVKAGWKTKVKGEGGAHVPISGTCQNLVTVFSWNGFWTKEQQSHKAYCAIEPQLCRWLKNRWSRISDWIKKASVLVHCHLPFVLFTSSSLRWPIQLSLDSFNCSLSFYGKPCNLAWMKLQWTAEYLKCRAKTVFRLQIKYLSSNQNLLFQSAVY